jgi:hypothetical protein
MQLNTHWITGFVDGEGCFSFSIFRNILMKSGYQIQGEFVVVQHKRNIQLLYALKEFFKCGTVSVNQMDCYHYRVKNNEHLLLTIIPFFEKYTLCSTKKFELPIFKQLCLDIKSKKHLTPEGFIEMKALVQKLSDIKHRN